LRLAIRLREAITHDDSGECLYFIMPMHKVIALAAASAEVDAGETAPRSQWSSGAMTIYKRIRYNSARPSHQCNL
jgi:hypothetical protein